MAIRLWNEYQKLDSTSGHLATIIHEEFENLSIKVHYRKFEPYDTETIKWRELGGQKRTLSA